MKKTSFLQEHLDNWVDCTTEYLEFKISDPTVKISLQDRQAIDAILAFRSGQDSAPRPSASQPVPEYENIYRKYLWWWIFGVAVVLTVLSAVMRKQTIEIRIIYLRGLWLFLIVIAAIPVIGYIKLKLEKRKTSPLSVACAYGKLEEVREILLSANGSSVINERNHIGITPLMYASKNGRIEVVQLLLAHGADAASISSHGSTAFSLAEKFGHIESAKIIAASLNLSRTGNIL